MAAHPVIASGRDIRLDLFRGLALWFIFVDHIPTNVVSWFTVRNYGFSDATEVFVFISGYTAVIARSEEHTSELQSQSNLVCRLLLEKKKQIEISMILH